MQTNQQSMGKPNRKSTFSRESTRNTRIKQDLFVFIREIRADFFGFG